MKKTILTLAVIAANCDTYAQINTSQLIAKLKINKIIKRLFLIGLCSLCFWGHGHAQGFFSTNVWTNSPLGVGANALWGWGENFDRTIDVRPNPHPTYGTMIINNHTGLTFSAHSFYGGIRFYNQGYPNPYDPVTGSIMVMSITNGNVGIGTVDPQNKLDVNGTIHTKEVRVDLTGWPDYVFKPKYDLLPLTDVKTYIDKNQRLPEMPSEAEVTKNGVNLGEIIKLQTKKIEELTLYLIEKDSKDKEKDTELQSQQKQINQLKEQLAAVIKSLTKN